MRDEPPNRVFSDSAFVQAVSEHEPVGTSDVAELVNCAYETARVRLEALEQQDEIEQKMIAGVSVWYTE